jgi:sulfate permease, SulP family
MSTVRRPGSHRAYLSSVAKQTTVMHLHGFLFFGTIAHVEDTIRDIVAGPTWEHNPVRFLVLDFTLVAGVDMSAAEALLRVKRILDVRDIVMVFCGVSLESPIGRSLESVGVLEDSELFLTFNDAMECKLYSLEHEQIVVLKSHTKCNSVYRD